MTWYHGTTNARFKPGDVIVPGRKAGINSNWSVFAESYQRELESGRIVDPRDVVWITGDLEEAADWAAHSTMKALPSEIRRMPAGGLAVYEVEPVGLDRPVDQHSRLDVEAVCERATVIREVRFDEFALDLCDECGAKATVGLGTDDQTCVECAEQTATMGGAA